MGIFDGFHEDLGLVAQLLAEYAASHGPRGLPRPRLARARDLGGAPDACEGLHGPLAPWRLSETPRLRL